MQNELINADKTMRVLTLIEQERSRPKGLWGENDVNSPYEWMSILGEEYGELCEAVNETYFQNPRHPERGGKDRILKEAVQIAAVATAIAEKYLEEA